MTIAEITTTAKENGLKVSEREFRLYNKEKEYWLEKGYSHEKANYFAGLYLIRLVAAKQAALGTK